MALDITPGDYFRIVMASGVAATLVTAAITTGVAWRQRRADAVPLLLETANALDGYAAKCDQMLDISYRVEHECWEKQSYDPISRVSIPKFDYPEGMPWGSLSKHLISALKGLPIMIDASQIIVNAEYREEPIPTDALPVEQAEIAKLGLHALELSLQLRKHKRLPLEQHQRERLSSTRAALETAIQKHTEWRARVDGNNAALLTALNSSLVVQSTVQSSLQPLLPEPPQKH